jgi:hypothetical protein
VIPRKLSVHSITIDDMIYVNAHVYKDIIDRIGGRGGRGKKINKCVSKNIACNILVVG